MKRREFIGLLGGATAGWPLAGYAQQPVQMRRIGVLMSINADNAEARPRLAAFQKSLEQLGWIDDRNVRIDVRWGAGDKDRIRDLAAEIVSLAPDAILAAGSVPLEQLLRVTRTLPIVFVHVVDPVGAGFVRTLARPGGNVTGLMQFEYSVSGKWLELLKQVAPQVTQAAILRDPSISSGIGQFAVIQSVASTYGVEVSAVDVRDHAEIENALTILASQQNGGLVVTSSAVAVVHRRRIIALAAKHKLPAVYVERFYVIDGGLISYGSSNIDQYRRATDYINRILRGEKAADLPVQAPTEYELVVNLKTANALGLTVPVALLARAAEVIE
jgi:putative tryptophan/tyrosine transport system substrate-binding protein